MQIPFSSLKAQSCAGVGIVAFVLALAGCGGGGDGGSPAPVPTPATYTIGGTVTGLTGSGLVLQENGGNNLAVSKTGSFTFTTPVATSATYAVTVLSQPSNPSQMCTASNGTGTVGTGNITNVVVSCTTSTETVGGTVSGISATGLVLELNGAGSLAISASGPFTFSSVIASGTKYTVTALSQPTGQTCTIANGTGTAVSNVINVAVTCATNPTFSIGGSVAGLTGTGLVLANGAATVAVSATATSFTFPTALQKGTAYSVTVQTQPAGQECQATASAGTVGTSNITSVTVGCVSGQWKWTLGATSANTASVYGTVGVPATTNTVGARTSAYTWTDAAGNLWLFGGNGVSAVTNNGPVLGQFNDLWKFNPTTNEWTWVAGPQTTGTAGVYGTQGVAAAGNYPGAREDGYAWTDSNHNFWLFGGYGYDSTGTGGSLNDLWEYNPTTGQWKWVSGSNVVGAFSVGGTQGVAAAGNVPGNRQDGAAWADAAGNLWLFGGQGDSSQTSPNCSPTCYGEFNDLWNFNITSGLWTWVTGSLLIDKNGVYGTQGVAAASNVPGARRYVQNWTDHSGNLWLFGGDGYPASGANSGLNDLWEFTPTTGLWTWVSGLTTATGGGQIQVYGIFGVAAPGNTPAPHSLGNTWVDAGGNLWLYGYGYNGSVDLWKFNPTTDEWAWMGGAQSTGTLTQPVSVNYGTEGVATATNFPGVTSAGVAWSDAAGHFWLFGGYGPAPDLSTSNTGEINDLWEYAP